MYVWELIISIMLDNHFVGSRKIELLLHKADVKLSFDSSKLYTLLFYTSPL